MSAPRPRLALLTIATVLFAQFSLLSVPHASATPFPTSNTPPVAQDDPAIVNEDGSVSITVGANDTDPDESVTIVEIDGQEVAIGDTVPVTNGSVTIDSADSLTFSPAADYSGPADFTYTISDFVATGPAGVSYHLESTNTNGPLLFAMDIDSAAKTYIGPLAFGSTTAMAFDDTTGYLYFIRSNGDIYGLDVTMPTSSAALVADIEDASTWAEAVPAAYTYQTAAFYDGSLFIVPTARPTPTLDDVLYRVDFTDATTVADVARVADMSGDTVGWNNNDDITIDTSTGIIYGRSDTNDQTNSERTSFFYSYDIATGDWQMIAEETYFHDYADSTNNPTTRDDFRDASIGMIVGTDGEVYGSNGRGDVGRLDPSDGAWEVVGTFVPDDDDLAVGGDFAGALRFISPSTATVTIDVAEVNDPPVAEDDSTTTAPGTPVVINPLGGTGTDTDSDGTIDPTSVTLVPPAGSTVDSAGAITIPDVGVWSVNSSTGEVTFTPAAGFDGIAKIDYTVDDDLGLTSIAASISVEVPDDGDPAVANDEASTPFDTAVTIDWSANDTIVDNAALSTFDALSVGGGVITVDGDGHFLYTPEPGFTGTDAFTYTMCDDDLPVATCEQAVVLITVEAAPAPTTTTTVAPTTTTTTTPAIVTTTAAPTTTTTVASTTNNGNGQVLAFTGSSITTLLTLIGSSFTLLGLFLFGIMKRNEQD